LVVGALRVPLRRFTMFDTLVAKVFGTRHEREVKRMRPLVARINELEATFKPMTDEDLQAQTKRFRERIAAGETLDGLLPEAFAVCREASRRVLEMRHYDVQLVGGIVLHRGSIAEMRTGEGKTLTATLALYLNALASKGAHLVTVNDYLASRDAADMGRLYSFLGLTTGTIVGNMPDNDRRNAYACDITYGTNNEYGFDYLRDNMKFELDRRVQRGLNFAIVDEVDSILVDEARTPLIISGQAALNREIYIRINQIIVELKRDEHYVVDEEHRSVTLTDDGVERVEERLGLDNLYEPVNIEMVHHVQKALEAHTLYKRDEQYMVREGKIVIVDEFTGRMMDGRRWSDGLHQAVEAKEGVQIQHESETLATITYQNFFRMYGKLSGMTGTADTEAEEFHKIYKLSTVVIPTNRPLIRLDQADLVYRTEREKFGAIIDQIEACHEKGQPVLVGTVSVDKSEVISKILTKKNIAHNVLNAKQHEREATVVAQAGRKGAVTIATNMAGRGTDILLGGNPLVLAAELSPDLESDDYKEAVAQFRKVCAKEKEEVLAAGGLFILGTERHDSRRIDNQLRGRAGRQGDPGESRFFLSLEDDLMRRFGADRIQGLMARLGMEEGVPIEAAMVSRSIENAQKRVEGRNFDVRKHLLEYDDVMDVQRKAIYGLRNRILTGESIDELVLDALDGALTALLDQYASEGLRPDDWDLDALARELKEHLTIEVTPEELQGGRRGVERTIWEAVQAAYKAKVEEQHGMAAQYNADHAGNADFTPKSAADVFHEVAQETYLKELDRLWRDHLNNMRNLRDAVSLQGYAQKDPKAAYKREGFRLFGELRVTINLNVAKYLMRMVIRKQESLDVANLRRGPALSGSVPVPDASALRERVDAALQAAIRQRQTGATTGLDASASSPTPSNTLSRRAVPKLGRNDMCWCGSGKKYKHCHMSTDTGAVAAVDGQDGDGEQNA